MRFFTPSLIAATVAISATNAQTCTPNVLSCSSAASGMNSCCVPTYGLVVLVQQWYHGLGPAGQFTLHGLWPDTCTGGQTGSSGCDSSRVYSNVGTIMQDYDSSVYDQMSTYWPSYTGDNNSFWSHEWSKHGTCVTTLDPSCYSSYTQYQDVSDYFTKVLSLRSQYDYYTALKNKGIVPTTSKKYTAAAFKAAIKAELGIDVVLKCSSGTLSEIWAWFNVQNQDAYVPTATWASDTCTTFSYPPKY